MYTLKHKTCQTFLGLIFFSVICAAVPVITGEFTLDEKTLESAEKEYGEDARTRLVAWQNLIREDAGSSELELLAKTNEFMNRMDFVSDVDHWNKTDYWATPIEFLGSDGGDCEDFALAKYFTLVALGVPEEKLNLTYVKALRLNQHHMVLTYFSEPGAEPLVLDNLVKEVLPASQRSDLLPIYSFNGTGLWLAKQQKRGKLVGSSNRLKLWQDVLQRLPEGMIYKNE